jgi:hypothetical protein
MKPRDETYIIDLCDKVLNLAAKRQHTFDFLRGDPSRRGAKGRKLPTDAFYPEIGLVIEYRERQHSESIPFFDKPERLTCSGCARGEQRARYDQRRRMSCRSTVFTWWNSTAACFCAMGANGSAGTNQETRLSSGSSSHGF